MPQIYHSELRVCTENMDPTIHEAVKAQHTNLLIMLGYFKSLFLINTAPVPIVLSTDISSQKEPSFTGKERKFGVKETIMLQKYRGSR
jgi:hypothetical protein